MKSVWSILILLLVAFSGETRANLDLGNLSILDDADELVMDKPTEVAGAMAAAAGAHSVARSGENKEVKAEAMEEVTKEIRSLPQGVAKDLAQAEAKVEVAVDQAKKDAEKSGKGSGLKQEKVAEKAVATIAGGIATEATAAVVEKLASDISTKNTPIKVASVESVTNTVQAIDQPGKLGKDNEKKIIDSANAVSALTGAAKDMSAATADKAAFNIQKQAEAIKDAPAGEAKNTAKAIEGVNSIIQKASSENQADTVVAVKKALIDVVKADDPKAVAGAEAAAADKVAKAGVDAGLAAAGEIKVDTILGAVSTKLGTNAAAAVANAALDAANSDLKADAIVASATGNSKVGDAVANAQAAVANAIKKSDSGDKREVATTLKATGAAVSEADDNKAKEASTKDAIKEIANGNTASVPGEPALAAVSDDLSKVTAPAAKATTANAAVTVARDAVVAGKQGEVVAEAVSTVASDIKKAGDIGGVVAANAAAEVVKLISENDIRANNAGTAKTAERVETAEATSAIKVLNNPGDAKEVAEAEKRTAEQITKASIPSREKVVALDVDKALSNFKDFKTATGAANAAKAAELSASTAEKLTPKKALEVSTTAAAVVGAVANAENGDNTRAAAVGVADSAKLIDAAAQTGSLKKTTQKINEVEGALNAAKKVVEAETSSEKAGKGKIDLSVLEGPQAQFITKAPAAIKAAASAIADSAAGTEAIMAADLAKTAAFVAKGTQAEVNAKAKIVRTVSTRIAQSEDSAAPGSAAVAFKYSNTILANPAAAANIAKKEDKKVEKSESSTDAPAPKAKSSSSSSSSVSPFSPFGYGSPYGYFGGFPFAHPAFPFAHPAFPFVHPAALALAAHPAFNPYAFANPYASTQAPNPFTVHPAVNPYLNPLINPYHPANFFGNPYFAYAAAAHAAAHAASDAHAADAHAADAHAADAHAADAHAADAHADTHAADAHAAEPAHH